MSELTENKLLYKDYLIHFNHESSLTRAMEAHFHQPLKSKLKTPPPLLLSCLRREVFI